MALSFIAKRVVLQNEENERFVGKLSNAHLATRCLKVRRRIFVQTVMQRHDVSYAQFLNALVKWRPSCLEVLPHSISQPFTPTKSVKLNTHHLLSNPPGGFRM